MNCRSSSTVLLAFGLCSGLVVHHQQIPGLLSINKRSITPTNLKSVGSPASVYKVAAKGNSTSTIWYPVEIDAFMKGFEHGHTHLDESRSRSGASRLNRTGRPFLSSSRLMRVAEKFLKFLSVLRRAFFFPCSVIPF